MAKFNAPVIQDNPSGWGPCAVPEKFKDMPYQPFSKGDRLGKVCPHVPRFNVTFSSLFSTVSLTLCVSSARLLTGLERLIKTRDTQVSKTAVHPDVSPPTCDSVCFSKHVDFLCYNEMNLSPDKYSSQFGGGSQYAYFHEEDETSFQLVDTAKTQKTAYQRNRMRFAQVPTDRPTEAADTL